MPSSGMHWPMHEVEAPVCLLNMMPTVSGEPQPLTGLPAMMLLEVTRSVLQLQECCGRHRPWHLLHTKG